MTQGQITSTVKQRIGGLGKQHTHSPQIPSIPNFHIYKKKKGKGQEEKEKNLPQPSGG